MQTETPAAGGSKAMLWTGRVLSALPALLLTFSGVMKFVQPEGMDKQMAAMGWDIRLAVALGVLELICTALYVLPPTAVLGAILLTGYLGGAIATHVRIGEPFIIQSLLGVLVWGGLWLRDARVRAILPVRR